MLEVTFVILRDICVMSCCNNRCLLYVAGRSQHHW